MIIFYRSRKILKIYFFFFSHFILKVLFKIIRSVYLLTWKVMKEESNVCAKSKPRGIILKVNRVDSIGVYP